MEYANCCICGSENAKLVYEKKEKLGIVPGVFRIVECCGCGLLYVTPRPGESGIVRFYPETYSWKKDIPAVSGLMNFVRAMESFYRFHLLKYEVSKIIRVFGRKKGRVLDIGCSTGDRLVLFRKMGFEAHGVEISDSADYAGRKNRLSVFKGTLSEASYPDGFFDLILLNNVIEHVHEPCVLLSEVKRILSGNGLVVIETPNIRSVQARVFKRRWTAIDPPRHLFYFSPETLGKLLHMTGLRVCKTDFFTNWWHPPTLVLSLFPELDPLFAWELEKKGRGNIFNRLFWIFLTFFASPVVFVEECLGRGAIFTVYARKKIIM